MAILKCAIVEVHRELFIGIGSLATLVFDWWEGGCAPSKLLATQVSIGGRAVVRHPNCGEY